MPTETEVGQSVEPSAESSPAGGWVCKYYSICDFFSQPDVAGTTEAALKHLYCFTKDRWVECHRLKYYQQTGENPPINLLPSGRMMPK